MEPPAIAAQAMRYEKVRARPADWHGTCTVRSNSFATARPTHAVKPEIDMASITVNDLSLNLALDRKAMAAIHGGGGAPWVYGWIQPFVGQRPSIGPVVNLYDITNNFYANQMINTFQSVDVRNTGANSNINVAPDARSRNDMV
jgi:hypothetical protein